MTVSDRRGEVGEVELFWREAPVPEGRLPTVYVHGVPGNSDDFLDFVPRSGGFALDLPGFGRSAKPAHFPYSIEGYAATLEAFLDDRGVERCSLVMHDWGTAALGAGAAHAGALRQARDHGRRAAPAGLHLASGSAHLAHPARR